MTVNGKKLPSITSQTDSGNPGGGQGRTDVTGNIPPDIHIDPDITEGHPGYEESGPSEIKSRPESTKQ